MKRVEQKPVVLGVGVLNWNRAERVTDRYGYVYLLPEFGGYEGAECGGKEPLHQAVNKSAVTLNGRRGALVAHVLKTRKSGHMGDFFHGVSPVTPKEGEEIVLGTGSFTAEVQKDPGDEPKVWVGIEPDDHRKNLKLDIKALYRAHDQTVRLEFVPDFAK